MPSPRKNVPILVSTRHTAQTRPNYAPTSARLVGPTPRLTHTPTSPPPITLAPTPTHTAPMACGGIALEADVRALPLETAEPESAPWGIPLAIAAAAASLAAMGVSYMRRRTLS